MKNGRKFAVYSDWSAVRVDLEEVKTEKKSVPVSQFKTKKEQFAYEIERLSIQTRKQAIEFTVATIGTSKAGASTYWANYNKGL